MRLRTILPLVAVVVFAFTTPAQAKRKVIIDQDARGAATTDQQSILMFLQSPNVETLGITVVSGDMWRDEEVAHTLRMLELTGHTDIPVYPGAVYPLINRMEMIERWEKLYGAVHYQGAWNGHRPGMNLGDGLRGRYHLPFEVPDLPEGNPTLKAQTEDAAHFIIRMVHKYPHEVTIYAGGPLTDIAQAISLDPAVSELAQELVVMGGSIAPVVPHDWIAEIAKSKSPASQYLAKYADEEYMWDELAAAAWLDPSVITQQTQYFMDIDISHTAGYGNVLVWTSGAQPGLGEQLVNIPEELNKDKFYRMFIDLMALPPASAHSAAARAGAN